MSTPAQPTAETNPLSSIGEALQTAAERFGEGAASAREYGKKHAESLKGAAVVALYNGSFGLSFGLVYSSVFLTELLPKDSVIRRGLEEGADAALAAHEKAAGKTEEAPAPAEAQTEASSEAKPKRGKKAKAGKKAS